MFIPLVDDTKVSIPLVDATLPNFPPPAPTPGCDTPADDNHCPDCGAIIDLEFGCLCYEDDESNDDPPTVNGKALGF